MSLSGAHRGRIETDAQATAPITILHVIDTLAPGGTEFQLVRTLQRLNAHGFRSTVCVLRTLAGLPRIAADRVEPHSLGLKHSRDYVSGVRRLVQLIRTLRPTVVHTYLFNATLIGRIAGRLTGRPVITTLVNTPYEPSWRVDDPTLISWKVGAVRAVDAATAAWTTRFVANSHAVKASAVRYLGVSPDRITVIYRGIDLTYRSTVSAEQIAATRQALGWQEAEPLIVAVGRLVPQKGHRYLVEAMETVAKAIPRARLAIAGEGRLRGQLEERLRSLTQATVVRLLGNRDDIPSLLAAADIFVLPSLSEGFPNALLEAMSQGKPCIASALPAVREIAGADGALLVRPESSGALAEAIVTLAADGARRRSLGVTARQRAQLFDLDRSARQVEDVYRDLAGDARPAGHRPNISR